MNIFSSIFAFIESFFFGDANDKDTDTDICTDSDEESNTTIETAMETDFSSEFETNFISVEWRSMDTMKWMGGSLPKTK